MKDIYTFDNIFRANSGRARDFEIQHIEAWAKKEDEEEMTTIADIIRERKLKLDRMMFFCTLAEVKKEFTMKEIQDYYKDLAILDRQDDNIINERV